MSTRYWMLFASLSLSLLTSCAPPQGQGPPPAPVRTAQAPAAAAGTTTSTAASAPPAAPAPSAEDAARFRADIRKVEDLLATIPDKGAALFHLARRHAQLGELPEALTLLKQCIS